MRAASDGRLFLPVMVALAVLAWTTLMIWGHSPYRGWLSHDQLGSATGTSSPHLAILVGGWMLMIFAMMLPTSLPLLSMVNRMLLQRPERLSLMVFLIVGYLMVWLQFGVVAHFGDMLIHRLTDRSALLQEHAWVIGTGTLAFAGAYQFTSIKYRCLDQCRSPLTFVSRHWRGAPDASQVLWLGMHHGLYCVGCCWALMLLMFIVGTGNLGWMLALGTIMAVEKNMPWGRRLGKPLGVTLLSLSALSAAVNLSLFPMP